MSTNPINANSGFDIQAMFNTMASTIETKGTELNAQLNAIKDGNMSQEEMLSMQFQINQYNMLLEATSTISKSMTDEAKQLAQRAS